MRKVAVTSTDGVHVNQHFGKASIFYIYNIDGKNVRFVEKRFSNPYCASEGQPTTQRHELDLDKIVTVTRILNDCETLYTQQIGEKPLMQLVNQGIQVQTCNCEIEMLACCGGKCS